MFANFDTDWLDPIYAASLKPTLWPGLLERLCGRVGAVAASINRIDPVSRKASLFFEHGTDPAYSASLLSTYAGMSPIGSAVLTAEVDEPLTAFDFIDEDEYLASRFYKEWCAPQGYFDMLGAILMKSPTDVSAISTVRTRSAGRYGAEERAFVGAVAPHVRRAVTISGLLDAREVDHEALATLADALAAAVFVIDAGGRIIRLNPAASNLLATGDIALRDGALTMHDTAEQSALRAAIAQSIGRPALLTFRSRAGTTFIASLLAARAQGPFVLVVNQQAPQHGAVGAALMKAFALTRRELTVLLALIKGQSIEDAAAELGIEVATARSHLHKIFAKTETTRQGELIHKVMASLPPVAG